MDVGVAGVTPDLGVAGVTPGRGGQRFNDTVPVFDTVAEAKAEIQADLNEAIAQADAEIAAKSAESEKAIAEIRASALESVQSVATDTTAEIVLVLGGKADAKAITAAVNAQLKG